MIDVIFKKDKTANEIITFFPYDFCDWQGNFTCYANIGQHSASCYGYYRKCVKCSPNEYKPLLNELKMIGYDNLNIINRINSKKFKDAYNDFMIKERMLRQCKQ